MGRDNKAKAESTAEFSAFDAEKSEGTPKAEGESTHVGPNPLAARAARSERSPSEDTNPEIEVFWEEELAQLRRKRRKQSQASLTELPLDQRDTIPPATLDPEKMQSQGAPLSPESTMPSPMTPPEGLQALLQEAEAHQIDEAEQSLSAELDFAAQEPKPHSSTPSATDLQLEDLRTQTLDGTDAVFSEGQHAAAETRHPTPPVVPRELIPRDDTEALPSPNSGDYPLGEKDAPYTAAIQAQGATPGIPVVVLPQSQSVPLPYYDVLEYMDQLLLQLKWQMLLHLHELSQRPATMVGFHLSPEEQTQLFGALPRPLPQGWQLSPEQEQEYQDKLAQLRESIPQRVQQTLNLGLPLPLEELRQRCRLNPFEVQVLLLALAFSSDARYLELSRFLDHSHNPAQPECGPSVQLALQVLTPRMEERLPALRSFTPDAPLIREKLLVIQPPNQQWNRKLPIEHMVFFLPPELQLYLLGMDNPPHLPATRALTHPLDDFTLHQDIRQVLGELAAEFLVQHGPGLDPEEADAHVPSIEIADSESMMLAAKVTDKFELDSQTLAAMEASTPRGDTDDRGHAPSAPETRAQQSDPAQTQAADTSAKSDPDADVVSAHVPGAQWELRGGIAFLLPPPESKVHDSIALDREHIAFALTESSQRQMHILELEALPHTESPETMLHRTFDVAQAHRAALYIRHAPQPDSPSLPSWYPVFQERAAQFQGMLFFEDWQHLAGWDLPHCSSWRLNLDPLHPSLHQFMRDTQTPRWRGIGHEIKSRVIGQDHVVDAMVDVLQISHAGLQANPSRPKGVFMLVGPSGVGKTETAKALSESLFGSDYPLLRIDMSEFHFRESASALIGTTPGYIGYEEGGRLTKAILQQPRQVVLLDEIEKAYENVLDIFLQVFDDGRLTDGQGQTVDFSETIFLMTSNIGAELFTQTGTPVGFVQTQDRDRHDADLLVELRKRLRVEFLNRVDEILIYHPLEHEQLLTICQQKLHQLRVRAAARGVLFDIDPAIPPHLVKHSDQLEGVRGLQRTLERQLLRPLARQGLDLSAYQPHRATLTLEEGKIQLVLEKEEL